MKVKALLPFTLRDDDDGELHSIACGQVVECPDEAGEQLIADGLAEAYTLVTPTGTKSITENASNIDVSEYAKANVNVPNPSTGKVNITGTEEVDVTNYATAQVVDANLVAGNIKKDVAILGVTGSYEGGSVVTPVTVTLSGLVGLMYDSQELQGSWIDTSNVVHASDLGLSDQTIQSVASGSLVTLVLEHAYDNFLCTPTGVTVHELRGMQGGSSQNWIISFVPTQNCTLAFSATD